jgi:hypothetical protein
MVLGVVALIAAGLLIALQWGPSRSAATAGAVPDVLSSPSVDKPSQVAPTPPVKADARDLAEPPYVSPFASNDADGAAAPNAPGAPLASVGSSVASPVASLEDVIGKAVPAIVSIETGEGRGSGFFAAPRTVLTNRHVIANNISVTVRLASGATLPGRVEKSSQEFDLAVVRVDGASLAQPVLPLGSVADVRPGQEVIAIGLALGVFQNSVTRGIISAVRRADKTVLLQTDAAINPGNSGGPLINRAGQVIGINTLKISGSAESLGFAVAIDHASGLLNSGRPADLPLSTSAPVSKPLVPAFGAQSPTDQMRDQGARRYDQVMQVVARRASELDSYWDRIKENCSTRVAPGYDREWFGLWDGRASLTSPDASCISAVRDLNRLADEVRTVMANAQEEARHTSVLPGQLREIRRRYRMDWPGWDR